MNKQHLPKGTLVLITSLNQQGTVIEQRGSNNVLVLVNNTKLRLSLEQISLVQPPSKKSKACSQKTIKSIKRKDLLKVDLHGQTVAEALDTIEQTLNQAILSGYRGMEVIHGFGSGKIKQALIEYCSNSPVVASTKTSAHNLGMTFVYFY